MKRHSSDHEYRVLKMLDDFAQSAGLSIKDEITSSKFVERISETVQKQRNNPIYVHGFRVESMFAHIAAALGKTQIITEEDCGVFYSSTEDIRRPDFRLITSDDTQILVEVKNIRQKEPMEPFELKDSYLSSLRKYADVFKIPLKIAIYWSIWKIWTLVDASSFISKDTGSSITMIEALKKNEMNLLGDHMVATVPPLSLRLYADPDKPQSIDGNGQAHFTIGRATLCAAGKEITDDFEKRLAWFFMLHGKWNEVNQPTEIKNGFVEYTEFSVSPEEYDKKQGFSILGYLSELITSNYNLLTSPEGEVLQLAPRQQPDNLCILIPHDYKGKVLPLWRFHVKPSFEDVTD